MAIDVIVYYNGAFLPDGITVDSSPYCCMVRWHFYRIDYCYYLFNYVLYYTVICFELVGGLARRLM